MCLFSAPKVPKIPPAAERQPMQVPQDMAQDPNGARSRNYRRGLWASIFTSPAGLSSRPTVTGSTGGVTGG